jgi:heat shock protein HslJ
VLPDTQLAAMFGDDGNVSGDTGCNTCRGPYTISDSTISFGALISTRRACLSDAARVPEQAFLAALSASTGVQLVGDRLTLRDAAGATQVLMVRSTVEPPPTGAHQAG